MAVHVQPSVTEYYKLFLDDSRAVKRELIGENGSSGWYVQLQTANTSWDEFVRVQRDLSAAVDRMTEAFNSPGFKEKAQEVEGPTYDITVEYPPMRNAILAIRDWIFQNLPTATQGGKAYILTQQLAQDGSLTDREFTPAQSAPLRTLIDQYRATVT